MLSYENCTLCPRKCGVNRAAGQLGRCRMPGRIIAARAAAHYWEEPVISGDFGSGAVFFSGCALGCAFCQNASISLENQGREISSARLREIFEALIDQGVTNINLVTATQFLPSIIPALTPKLPVPVVWNSGGYESVETLRELEGLIDIYLPDFKFATPDLGRELANAPDYPAAAAAAIREMYRQTGPAVIENGVMTRGTMVRHLVLPGHVDNALAVLDWLSDAFPAGAVPVSLMRQYYPAGRAASTPPYDRVVTDEEYEGVLSWMYLLGMENGYTQEAASADACYTPPFDGEGL